jgi:outer membrane protein insertion porin family
MQKKSFFTFVLVLILSAGGVQAQVVDTSKQLLVSSNTELKGVMDQMNPQKYKVAGIRVTGNTSFATNLLLAIAGVNEGSTIVLPGGDELSKSIRKLWIQNYFSDITYYLVGVRGNDIYLELNVTERPKVTRFFFRGISKSQSDDIKAKAGITAGQALTDNMIRNAVEAIRSYFYDKGFRQVSVDVSQVKDSAYTNAARLYFDIHKGQKVKIDQVTFFGNENLKSSKLRTQLKNTKEVSRMTLFPPHETFDTTGWGVLPTYTFKNYVHEGGFLTYTKIREILSPYLHLNPFS